MHATLQRSCNQCTIIKFCTKLFIFLGVFKNLKHLVKSDTVNDRTEVSLTSLFASIQPKSYD